MTEFLNIALSFPTVLFAGGLGLMCFYWGLAIVGAVDLELFDGIDGAIDGAVDGVLDGAVEGAIDGAIDGALEAAGDAAAEGAAESVGAAASGGMLVNIATLFRLGKVPVSVSFTAFLFWGWVAGFILTWCFQAMGGPAFVPPVAFSVAAMISVVVIATGLTNVSVRPLEPVFKTYEGRERKSLIGETCDVTTGRVDERFGQAQAHIGNDDLLIQVRCDKRNTMRRGSSALIVAYDTQRDAFIVEQLMVAKVEHESPAVTAAGLAALTPTTNREV